MFRSEPRQSSQSPPQNAKLWERLDRKKMSLEKIAKELRGLARPIAELSEDPENLRLHDDRSVAALKSSLQRFGQRVPIVVRGSKVIAGNCRLRAARELGFTHLACVDTADLDDQTALIYSLVDNRSAEVGSSWDLQGLADVLSSLKDEDLDLEEIGWDDDELSDILDFGLESEEEAPEVPETPEPPVEPRAKPKMIISLGDHRLVCGESTDEQDVLRLFFLGESPDLIVTDPPYGVGYLGDILEKDSGPMKTRKDLSTIQNDALEGEDLQGLIEDFAKISRLKPGGCFYIFAPPGGPLINFYKGLEKADLSPQHQLVWVKNIATFGRPNLDYRYQHEIILYGWKSGAGHYYCGDRKQTSVWEAKKPSRNKEHPTMKPLELIQRCILNSSKRGDLVYDGFLGSGTTLLAAEITGRRCFGIESDPGYCDVIVRRWEELTGKQAVWPE